VKWFPALLLFLVFSTGIAEAGAEQQINERLKAGGTVYLSSGIYEIEDPIVIGSNTVLTGDPDAIIRVFPNSGMWFKPSEGIITCTESVKNVEISGFQIDGNCENLPASYASTPGHDHDCEHCIYLRGYSNDYADNILIHDMKLYDSFSDAIQLRLAKNSACYNNFISNCQHEGIFWSSALDSQIYGNQIAGVCSDSARLDNCVNCKVHDNVFFSYSGDHNNGEYEHGESGLQLGDGGASHGYNARTALTATSNIEVYGNTFAANGLKAIVLGSAALASSANVFIHDNKFIGKAELETSGISLEISNSNPSTIERSEKVFSSIFDIRNQDFNFQYPDIQVPINASVSVSEYNNSYNTHSLVYVDGEGLTSVKYEYGGNSTTHYYSINGEKSDIWTGDLPHKGCAVYLPGRFDTSKLTVTCFNSKGYHIRFRCKKS
jgi:Right handed beta helix region